MKKILVYGDSNTWGDNIITNVRIPDERQWCNILQNKLGNNYKVFQEGLPGRVAGSLDKENTYKNGKETFISTFKTNAPVDIVIIALGSNDLKPEYNRNSEDIINDLLWYKETINSLYKENNTRYFNNKLPEIIYVLPINFNYPIEGYEELVKERELQRQNIIKYFIQNNIRCIYFDDIDLFEDGMHMNYDGHQRVADKVFLEINS